MRAYVMSTGSLFAVLTIVHVWRWIEEGSHVITDPWFIGITLVAIGFVAWAWRLLRETAQP